MQKVSAVLGSALFFVVAPCVLAGLIPWSMTRWEFRPAFLGLEVTRAIGVLLILIGLPGLVELLCAICASRVGHTCARRADQELGGHRALPVRAQSYLRGCGRDHRWSGFVVRRLGARSIRCSVLAGLPPVCRRLRRADAAGDVWRGVRGVSRERPALGSAGDTLESTGVWLATARKEMRSGGCVPCGKFRQVWARLAWKTRSGNVRPWDPRRTISIDKPHSRSLSLIPRTSGRALADQVIE